MTILLRAKVREIDEIKRHSTIQHIESFEVEDKAPKRVDICTDNSGEESQSFPVYLVDKLSEFGSIKPGKHFILLKKFPHQCLGKGLSQNVERNKLSMVFARYHFAVKECLDSLPNSGGTLSATLDRPVNLNSCEISGPILVEGLTQLLIVVVVEALSTRTWA